MSAPGYAEHNGAHTPGPWEYRGDGLYAEDDDYPFLWGWDDGGLVGRSEPVHAANIRLIAAAPDMLSALKEIVDGVPRVLRDEGLLADAEAAIAKAAGGNHDTR